MFLVYMYIYMYIHRNECQNVCDSWNTHRYIVSSMSHREGNREGISSGGRCTKVERGDRKAEVSLFPPYFEFEIEPRRGDTREPVISSKFDSIMKCKGEEGERRKERLFVLWESRLDFVICKLSHPEWKIISFVKDR